MAEQHDDIYDIVAESGLVLVDGPGTVMSLTPPVAIDMAERLKAAADLASRQLDEAGTGDAR